MGRMSRYPPNRDIIISIFLSTILCIFRHVVTLKVAAWLIWSYYLSEFEEIVMDQAYRDATTKMEEMGLQEQYIIGWQGGYLGHPEREEQQVNDAYTAGYEDGAEKNEANFANWK